MYNFICKENILKMVGLFVFNFKKMFLGYYFFILGLLFLLLLLLILFIYLF